MGFTILALVLNLIAMAVSIVFESWISAGTNLLVCAVLVWWMWAEKKKAVAEIDKQLYNGHNQQG